MRSFIAAGLWIVVGGISVLGFTPRADAGGVGLLESGGKRMGSAFAGGAAEASDATTVWWNPAGMTRLRRHNFVATGHLIAPTFDYSDRGSMDVAMMPLTGGDADGGLEAVLPSAYVAYRLNRCWNVGLSVNTPYGLATEYPDDWVGRYYATESELITFNFNPSVAYRVNNRWSVGAGVSAMYAAAKLENRVDFGAFAAMPQALDGNAKIEGDSWALGWNVGVLYQPSCRTRFGLHYRSRVKHTIEGDGEFVVPAAVAGGLPPGLFTDSDAEAEIELPDSVSLSGYHRVNNCLAVMADVTWTHWKTFDELVVDFDNPVQPNSVLDLDWKNTWRVGLGVAWTPYTQLELRAGVLFDEGPAPTKNRTPRVPDADRFWITAGVGYRFNKSMRVDLSYAYLRGGDAKVNQSSASAGSLVGEFDSDGHILGLQLTFDF